MSVRTNAGFIDSSLIGEIKIYPVSIIPDGWLACDGSEVSRTDYPELFEIIGTLWGEGNGTTTFNVPDFSNRIPVGKGTGIFANIGDLVGEETHQIKSENLPKYIENVNATTINKADLTFNGTVVTGITKTQKGSNTPVEISNVQPSAVVNYIIKAK